jgi:hypothetical protein
MIFDNRRQNPVTPHMLDKRLGFVLNKKIDGIYVRINKIAQNKIYYPVSSAKWYGWFGTKYRERKKPLAFTSGKNKCKNLWM